jgi:L-threonylcarbamoyladenylate synthase
MIIKVDDVFIYPTDTVWGIGCSLYSEIGHSKIAEIKKTAKNKPLSIMFASVQDIFDLFHFPEEVTYLWLEEFFTLESTLIFPVKALKTKIPKWATGDSDYVSLRTLNLDVIKEIASEIQTPFFTTSLNLTGSTPITNLEDARVFWQAYSPDAHFLTSKVSMELSGLSSTIVLLEENLDFEIKRNGRRVEEIKKHIMKLFFK